MPLPTDTPLFSVDEAAAYLMVTDPVGAVCTYGAKIPIPGINGTTVDPDVLSKELYGDNRVQGHAAVLRKIMVGLTYARMSQTLLALVTGGTSTASGTTPAQKTTFSIGKSASPPYVKVEYRIVTNLEIPGPSGGGSVNVKLNKCKVADWKPTVAKEDYGLQVVNFACVFPQGTSNIIDMDFNETAVALSA